MINKAFGGVIVGGIGIVVFGVLFFGGFIGVRQPSQETSLPTEFNIEDIEIKQINDQNTTLNISFIVTNPNKNTLILEEISYDIYADNVRIAKSSVGSRLEGVITGTGKTYYLLTDIPIKLDDVIEVKKTPQLEGVWERIQSMNVTWRLKGTYIITDPIKNAGQEHAFDKVL